MRTEEEPQVKRKVCLVGDPGVGKTSLVRRFVLDRYDDSYIQTIGAKVSRKDVTVPGGDRVRLLIWDVMGQKTFKIISSTAFEHTRGAFIVCDLSKRDTLDNVSYWSGELTRVSGDIPLILLANKYDLKDRLAFDESDVAEAASGTGGIYYLTSAKTGENVEAAFKKLAELCIGGN